MSAKAKGKGKGKGKTGSARGTAIRISEHPRAQRSINVLKSYAGLGAFLFAGYSSWQAGNEFVDVATRALTWGIAAYVLVWALAVQVWRQLAVAEVRAAEKRWRESRQVDDEQVAKLTQILEDNGMPTTGARM